MVTSYQVPKRSNIALFYFLKVICRISWQAASFCLSLTLLKAASPIVNTLLSAKLLGQLTAQETPHDIGQTIFAAIGCNLAVGLIQPFLAGRFATLTEKLKAQNKTKTQWLNEKVDEELGQEK